MGATVTTATSWHASLECSPYTGSSSIYMLGTCLKQGTTAEKLLERLSQERTWGWVWGWEERNYYTPAIKKGLKSGAVAGDSLIQILTPTKRNLLQTESVRQRALPHINIYSKHENSGWQGWELWEKADHSPSILDRECNTCLRLGKQRQLLKHPSPYCGQT